MISFRSWRWLIPCACALLLPLHANPLEEAQALMRQGNTSRVEELLTPLLEQTPAPLEAVRLSFEAARKDGRVFTAERRVRELIDRDGQANPRWIYEGALVARDMGDEARSLDRLMFFARQQSQKTPELEYALRTLSLRSTFPTAFRQYRQLYGKEQARFSYGMDMLRRIRAGGQAAQVLEMAGYLLSEAADAREANEGIQELFDALEARMFGLERDAVYGVIFAHPVRDLSVIRDLVRRQNIELAQVAALQKAWNRPLPVEFVRRMNDLNRLDSAALRAQIARDWLEAEPVYRQHADALHLRAYVWSIVSQPQVFLPETGPLLSDAQMATLLRRLLALHTDNPERLRNISSRIFAASHRDTPHRFLSGAPLRIALLREAPAAFRADELRELVQGREQDLNLLRALLELSGDRQDVRMNLLESLSRHNHGEALVQTVRREFRVHPTTFSPQDIARHFLSNSEITTEVKVRAVEEGWRHSGNTPRFRELVAHRDNRVRNEAGMQELLQRMEREQVQAADPILALLVRAANDGDLRRGREASAAFTALMNQAFDAYGRAFPDASVSEERTRYLEALLSLYEATSRNSREGRREYARVVSPRLSASADWDAHIQFTIRDNSSDGASTFHTAKAYIALHNEWLDEFGNLWHDEGNEDAFLRPVFGKLDAETLKQYLSRHRTRWSGRFLAEQLDAALKAHDLREGNPVHIRDILGRLAQEAETVGDAAPMTALTQQFFSPRADGTFGGNWEVRRELQRLFVALGRQQDGITAFVAGARRANPADGANVLMSMLGESQLVPVEPTQDTEFRDGHRRGILMRELLPLLEKIPATDAAQLFVNHWAIEHINWFRGRNEAPAALKTELNRVQRVLTRLMAQGARGDVRSGDTAWAIRITLLDAIERKAWPEVVDLVLLAGRSAENASVGQVNLLIEPLQAAELYEPLFLLTQVLRNADPAATSLLMQTRNIASARVPGLLPVDVGHPAYPLFRAAQELDLNNPEQAWALLRANLSEFANDPLRFPAPFVAWSLERLRQVRGEDNVFLDRSLELSNLVIARRDEVPLDILARVMLNRAELFRDQRNFDAARLEYQALRTNPDFQNTPAGRQAMFRDVDLMIAMGNTSAAEGLLEFWLANPDVTLQANAHYFNALIAFENGDDSATRENLDKVFAIDFTHTEARLLHGRWRLRTNFEVDNPEILLGDLRDRTILRPGQPLRITVQDQNLAVVGGGAAIPIRVRTTVGGDAEELNLFPSTRDPRLFRGVMDTVLGQAVPGNRVLEVNGLDVIEYEIDPAFLSSRGMERSEAKTLRIVDDAVLMVSAGNLLSEAEQQAQEIQRQMSASSGQETAFVGDVRPGNPVYVMVRDRDQSRGGEGGGIRIRAETRSGDSIPAFELRETAPHSGIFRGEIPTALPPPRAAASDTADGTLAGNTINVNRPGVWRSRADGEAGKWLEADTMNSHLVRRVELITPNADAIAEIRLLGKLTGELTHLGSIPQRAMPGGGVQLRITEANLQSLTQYRDHFGRRTDEAVSPPDFRYEVKDTNRRIHLRGAFYLPESRSLNLHLIPLEPDDRNALRDAWIRILVNGEVIANGRASDLRTDAGMPVSLAEGGHVLEVFGYVRHGRDGFVMGYERADGGVEPIPASWFSVADNPPLAEFLSDRARLRRTDEGFAADFPTPVRLRTLRWEFARYTGDAVTVREFRVIDAEGKTVLPGPSDFTDALENDILEIAPGDRITLTYQDEQTTTGQRRVLSRELGARFTNGTIGFYFERLTPTAQGMTSALHRAYRFRPGDSFMVVVQDADADISPAADTLPVVVTTRGGERLELTAVEQGTSGQPVHSGRFVALLRTTESGQTGGDTIRVRQGDRLTASYLDTENTVPGIPDERSVELDSVQPAPPLVTLFHTWRERREDTGPDAARRLDQIRARPGNQEIGAIHTWDGFAMPMQPEEMSADPVVVNVDTSLPIEVYHPSAAMHAGSRLMLVAVAESEIQAAQAEGREPNVVRVPLPLGRARGGLNLRPNPEVPPVAPDSLLPNAFFGGVLSFRLGQAADSLALVNPEGGALAVQGNDRVQIRIVDEDRNAIYSGNLQLASEASLALLDSSFQAERTRVHLGERFFVQVIDLKRDSTPARDRITVTVETRLSGERLELELEETLPNSGVFTGVLLPEFKRPEGQAASEDEEEMDPALMGIPRIGVAFGDTILFHYRDEGGLPHRPAATHTVEGRIFDGSDGKLWAFTKQFDDPDMAVRVQFRLSESLFEMAKDYRRLNQRDRSSAVIDEGKRILEEVLLQNPETALAVEGEYLLAHLYQEFGNEAEKEDPEADREFFQEALARFSSLLSNHPDSDFAPRAQYQKALALEKLGDFAAASEEYVKLTYIFPDSPLVGDASIRLATHYFRNEQRFDVAGRIFSNFATRFPNHPMAARAMFMSAQSHLKQAEVWEDELRAQGLPEAQVKPPRVLDEYMRAVAAFQNLIDDNSGTVETDLRAQAMYWAGDASLRGLDYPTAYIFLRRTVFEYPETEWARRARGLLLQSAELFQGLDG